MHVCVLCTLHVCIYARVWFDAIAAVSIALSAESYLYNYSMHFYTCRPMYVARWPIQLVRSGGSCSGRCKSGI